jgi:hypothetical protein
MIQQFQGADRSGKVVLQIERKFFFAHVRRILKIRARGVGMDNETCSDVRSGTQPTLLPIRRIGILWMSG